MHLKLVAVNRKLLDTIYRNAASRIKLSEVR